MSKWQSVRNTQFPRLLFSSALSVLPGVVLDRAVGDPGGRWHPVAVFGRYAAAWERVLWAPSKNRGVLLVVLSVAPPVVGSWWLWRRWPMLTNAVVLASCLGGTTLERTGVRVAEALEAEDIAAARGWVPWLCSRDPECLDADGIARAAVESLAENLSDAVVASLCFAPLGAPWVVLHRAVNTLDAMVGYRNDRYAEFGWASAKLDDALAFIPARLCAGLLASASFLKGRGAEALRAWREDAPAHPSPNAGPVEATAAAALGVRLGGATQYAHGVERRPVLGRGRGPGPRDVRAAVRLIRGVQVAAVGVAVVGGAVVARSLA